MYPSNFVHLRVGLDLASEEDILTLLDVLRIQRHSEAQVDAGRI